MRSVEELLLILLISFTLTGCYKSCATGDPLGLLTYCDKASQARLFNPKPYGAHWIKERMTKESRRVDIAACGAKGNESVNFLPREIQAAKQSDDTNSISAEGRLTMRWAECMRDKGYAYLEYCDARCQYP
ncbi:hypothetical protein [Methylophilus sp. 5]|uniref:hypothetical protein n=1 Tax=Methylophilus sp. 5 TaxID=1112274 RepID=UPI000684AA52|nr:hypothetical protein [Methylophilus sp. 5]